MRPRGARAWSKGLNLGIKLTASKKNAICSVHKLSLYSRLIFRANFNLFFRSLSVRRPFWRACKYLYPWLRRNRYTVRKEACLGLTPACCISRFRVNFPSDFLNFGISRRSNRFCRTPNFRGCPMDFSFCALDCFRGFYLPLKCGTVRHGICATAEGSI